MSNANPTLLGQNNGAGAADALFRDIFTGEVLTAFNNKVVTMDKHDVRNISNGNTATFYATGKQSGGYHVPGTEVTGRQFKQGKITVATDDILYTDSFIAEIDELKTAYEVRGEISRQQGDFLAQSFDKNVLRQMVLAARTAATVTGNPGGVSLALANADTDSNVFVKLAFAARQSFQERSIPWEEATLFLRPAMNSLVVQNKDVLNKLWGGEGSYAQGSINMIAGMPLVVTNNLPKADLSGDTAITAAGEDPNLILAKYRGNFSKTQAVISTRDSVATVKLRDLITEVNYDPRRFGTLITSRFALGHGVKRPECAIELASV